MSDHVELKPCPFCGNADVSARSEWMAHPVEYMGRVECGDCDTVGPLSEYKYDNEDDAIADAIAVWNTRAAMQPAEAAQIRQCKRMIEAGANPQDMRDLGFEPPHIDAAIAETEAEE